MKMISNLIHTKLEQNINILVFHAALIKFLRKVAHVSAINRIKTDSRLLPQETKSHSGCQCCHRAISMQPRLPRSRSTMEPPRVYIIIIILPYYQIISNLDLLGVEAFHHLCLHCVHLCRGR
jgi:hypothetical protein